MKNLYVILWVINSFIGTGFLSNELQEDEYFFSSSNRNENFKPFYAGEEFQHHSNAFYDFDFEYGLSLNEKSIHLPLSGYIIKIYSFVFFPQTSILPLLYDLPPPDSMV
jgi:hypothetical protein